MPTRSHSQTSVPISDATWYKDAIVYQLHVKSFYDSNNDGIGDFAGLIQKLDYIASLGINTVWLLPFYPSPLRDDGYDIAEYCAVHPDYGTMEDAQRFIREAHDRGLRVITELVINHTSDQHPWFQRARKAPPDSAERNFYVWSDNDQKYSETRIIFLDTEKSNWAWDPEAQAYYWHRFYSHQPDLNFDNPAVLDAVLEVMEFWLEMGVDGLRLDAVPYLVEREGTNNENLPETHEVLKKIRAKVDADYPDRLLLAEANQWPEDTQHYFGDGDECHMAFHFPLMPRIYMALAQEDRFPITDILRQTPEIPENCQWAIFLRNHDELTLEMVTDRERDYLWDQYASDVRARLNLGIRRRLAPLMQKDRRRLELLHSLLLTMPGTPILYYGDEIGMGDNIFLGDRDGVRTPMQWTPDRNGGFSRADPAKLVLPAIMDPLYGYTAVNVESQFHNPHSFLNWLKSMLEIRQKYHAFGRGGFKMLFPSNRRVLAYIREYIHPGNTADGEAPAEDVSILCLANMSRTAQAVELDLAEYAGMVPLELSGGSLFPPIGALSYLLTLPPYGFYWFLLAKETAFPDWYSPPPEPMPDFITLVLRSRVSEICDMPIMATLENSVLPEYLAKRRWFAGKDAKILSTKMANTLVLKDTDSKQQADHQEPVIVMDVVVELNKETQRYQLPLTVFFEESVPHPALVDQLALARVRRRRRVGLLTDALAADSYALWLVRAMQKKESETLDAALETARNSGKSRLIFDTTSEFNQLELDPQELEVRHLHGEQSNTTVIIAEQAVLKVFRRLYSGPNPEVEISRVLAENNFPNTGTLLGHATRADPDGKSYVLAVLQRYIASQGDAWSWVLNKLERFAHEEAAGPIDEVDWSITEEDVLDELSRVAHAIGLRLAQMHDALARSSHPAFAPELADRALCDQWRSDISAALERAIGILQQAKLDERDQLLLGQLVDHKQPVLDRIAELCALGADSPLIRIHGDLHLGQILVAQDDAYFIDFEGEPARPLEERSAKSCPLRDVAGVLRSLNYVSEMALEHFNDHSPVADPKKMLANLETTLSNTFREAYFTTADDLGATWLREDSRMGLTQLFLLDKALYEIGYEAANRPDWVPVPFHGLINIITDCGVSFQG
ncbi:maltose alpha-D-glucosyltransferase [Gilvimarinus sp. F26214L]|uniref:maltose alpha-D-glucosyltransferase n=1 Tax=Gilvimarinus sp. DZF01 TaxID=3461371 RepID=UPI0040459405